MDTPDLLPIGDDPSLLIVDDDAAFRNRLARAMEGRGFAVSLAESVSEGISMIKSGAPAYAVVDLRLEDGTGLDVVEALRGHREDAKIIILTGYGAIASAVAAVKAGAVDYLSKPADADDIENALRAPTEAKPPPPENPMSADRVRCPPTAYGGNISSGSLSYATEMSARPRAVLICTDAPYSASSRNDPHVKDCPAPLRRGTPASEKPPRRHQWT